MKMNWKEWFRDFPIIESLGTDGMYQAFKARMFQEWADERFQQAGVSVECDCPDMDCDGGETCDNKQLRKFTLEDMLSFGRNCTNNAMTNIGREESLVELLKEWREKNNK